MFSSMSGVDDDDFGAINRVKVEKKKDEFEQLEGIVVEFGNGFVKAGFGGDEAPRTMFPNSIGIIGGDYEQKDSQTERKYYVGDEITNERINQLQEIRRTMKRGEVQNWDDFENVMHHCLYNELRIDTKPKQYSLTIADSPLLPPSQREKMTSLVFEKFDVSAFYIGIKPVLSAYSTGRTSGLVCQCGYGTTSFVPVYEGECIKNGISKINLGGQDISSYLSQLYLEKERNKAGSNLLPFFNKNREYRNEQIFETLKEHVCYVCYDHDNEKESVIHKSSYQLPDNESLNIIQCDSERYQAPELLFHPSLFVPNHYFSKGIHEFIFESIMKSSVQDRKKGYSDFNLHKDLFRNIIVCGGTTLIPGFPERIEREVEILAKNKYHQSQQVMKKKKKKKKKKKEVIETVKVISNPERKYASWIGGSILCSLSSFKNFWVTKKMFEESGANIIHKKFL